MNREEGKVTFKVATFQVLVGCENISCSVVSDSMEPMDCNLPGSSVHGISQAKNTGVGGQFLLPRIFSTQGSNPGLLYCREALLWRTLIFKKQVRKRILEGD